MPNQPGPSGFLLKKTFGNLRVASSLRVFVVAVVLGRRRQRPEMAALHDRSEHDRVLCGIADEESVLGSVDRNLRRAQAGGHLLDRRGARQLDDEMAQA